ncbi:AMP-binding protein [Nocardioides massiliensis]|uniref:Long-chain acyl-CoA synthetase n=1 Tax=Nocardioides massiliensis TaxID=1325935 RepID=A0ABT9NML0_9ACTN|nr:AMP-binding protein [Nocardioides massiliensis]MDP9821661.1 long-chain acyl-CoA synthetase [Nocardioides massiliensis]
MAANLAALLTAAVERAPDATALLDADTGQETTWAELADAVGRHARGLGEAGLVAGHRVALCLGNTPDFVTAYLAVLRAGMVAVPLNPRATPTEIGTMVADSGARLVVAEAATAPAVREAVAGYGEAIADGDGRLRDGAVAPVVALVDTEPDPTAGAGECSWAGFASDEPLTDPPPRDPETLAVLLYTSGTSGRPRGAMLSHRALLANLEQAAAVEPRLITPDDRVLGVLPLFHIYGLNAVLGGVLREAATVVLVRQFEPDACLDVIARHGVTVLPVAPPVFGYWRRLDRVAERLSGVRLVLSGSAPLAPEVMAEFEERTGLPVHQGYGLTEAAPVVTSTRVTPERPPAHAVGAPLPGVEISLREETGEAPVPGDPGEILVRGDNLFSGYWPDGADGPDAECWWATGDVGYLDPDGVLYLVDRLKELVIVSGFNVYPSEVEDVLTEVDGVAEAAVLGVPDEETGEAVRAYLRLDDGRDADEVLAAARAYAEQRLARFKQPHAYDVVAELPRTATGKIAKGRLRAAIRRQQLDLLA